jgi:hypothetical protein
MIFIIEPQCRGFQHEKCNSGAIALYLRAFPNEEVHFFAEKTHLENVCDILVIGNICLDKLKCHEIQIPDSVLLSRISTIFKFYVLFNQILGRSDFPNISIKKVVLLSAYSFNLIAFKLSRALLTYKISVDIYLHGAIESLCCEYIYNPLLIYKRVLNFISNKFNFNFKFKIRYYTQFYDLLLMPSFYLFSNANVKYILFREDSLLKFKAKLPLLKNKLLLVNLPNINYNELCKVDFPSFAYIYRGEEVKFENLVNSLESSVLNQPYCFSIYLSRPTNFHLNTNGTFKFKVHTPNDRSRLEIDNFILQSKYVIYLYSEDSYELTTSGAFFDAIMHGKPVLFLKNHCFDYYFEGYKFGYRFDNILELNTKVVEIINFGDPNYNYFLDEIDKLKYLVSTENNFNKLIYEDI